MGQIVDYKDLKVWTKSYELALFIYRVTMNFPKSEIYGITSQMRRAAVSMPSNIAEGYRRRYTGEYLHFLSFAFGSCAELETQISLTKDIGFMSEVDFHNAYGHTQEISKMLGALVKSLKKI
ncbi:MAG: four helix bundle protein [Endomicrobiia bacterium]|nr:four helix bundle protein [Endomicrobiia bacterium]